MVAEVHRTTNDSIDAHMLRYEHVRLAFSKYFTQQQIDELVDNKSDVVYVQQQLKGKASIEDHEYTLKLLEQLHARLKQLGVV